MFGLFKKDKASDERPEPDYPVIANLRIGATLNPVILDIALAKENGESVLLEKMQETLIINGVHSIDLDGTKVYRYLTNSGEMLEITVPEGIRPEDSDDVILYTLFDQVGFACAEDVDDWIAEGQGHMGQPVFSIMPDPDSDEGIEYLRMIHEHSDHWAHPVELSVEEVWGNPYEPDQPVEKAWSDRKLMLFGRDLPSINAHEQLLMDLDEQKGVINLYVGIPVKLKDLNIT